MIDHNVTPKRWIIGIVACLMIAFSMPGCEFRRVTINTPINEEDVEFIVVGETSLREVVDHLGAPHEITGSDDLAVFHYEFGSTKTFRVNFGWIARIWAPVSPAMVQSRGATGTDVFQVVFDSTWIVRDATFLKGSHSAKFNIWPF